MIALAEGLSAYLVSNSSNRYLAHGQFGIFAGGAQLHARKRLPNYEGVKTRFLFNEVCSLEHAHGHARHRRLGVVVREHVAVEDGVRLLRARLAARRRERQPAFSADRH